MEFFDQDCNIPPRSQKQKEQFAAMSANHQQEGGPGSGSTQIDKDKEVEASNPVRIPSFQIV